MSIYLFAPATGGATVKQGATTSASTPARISTLPRQGPFQIRVYNDGTTLGFIEFGNSSVTATTSSIPIPPGVPQGFTITHPANGNQSWFSVIMSSSTANFYITPGFGI